MSGEENKKKGAFKRFTNFFISVGDDEAVTKPAPAPLPKQAAPPRARPQPKKSLYDDETRWPLDVGIGEETGPPESVVPQPGDAPELESFRDIYSRAGLPGDGFTVYKMLDIMNSPHLVGLEGPAIVASVKVALEASGVSVQTVIDDATYRAVALDAYEKDLGPRLLEFQAHITTECEAHKAEGDKLKAQLEALIQQKHQEIAALVATLEAKQVDCQMWRDKKRQELQRLHAAIDPFVEGANPVRIED